MTLPVFNKYMIFADEAGDHLLKPAYKDFPLFVLAFCIVEREHYANFIAPELLRIKLKYFQDSHVVFHEREIRKAEGIFSFLTNTEIRTSFFNDLNAFMEKAEFTVIASVIHKERLQQTYCTPENPYTLGAGFCIERLYYFLNRRNETLPATIAFEARGKKEDEELELACLRITQAQQYTGRFTVKIIPKISNCCGLQLADLVARPIGRHVLNSQQPNRAYDIIKGKMDANNGRSIGYGLKIFP